MLYFFFHNYPVTSPAAPTARCSHESWLQGGTARKTADPEGPQPKPEPPETGTHGTRTRGTCTRQAAPRMARKKLMMTNRQRRKAATKA